MPADSEMGFGTARFRVAVAVARRSRVSEMVVGGGGWERRRMKDSMAATGMVSSGSVARRSL